jgi:hypothetical protein
MVVVADREADIYEYLLAAQEKKLDLLVRARLNRKLAEEAENPPPSAKEEAAAKPKAAGKGAARKGAAKKAVIEEVCELGEIKEPDPEALRLQAHLESLTEAGRIELSVPHHGKQKARTALMSVRYYAKVLFAPPKAKAKLPPIPMWVVWTTEISPPKDAEPLEWFLLTTVPAASLEDAAERIVWYGRRWGIEVFHRILKSGCNIES